MTQWRKRLQLKDLLGEDDSEEAVMAAAASIVKRLQKLPTDEQEDLDSVITELEDIAQNDPGLVPGLRCSLCEYFNRVLSALYDWADDERVWID